MPGVVSLRQNSETQSKPSYFRGHCCGAIGALIGKLNASFCIPLSMALHQGFKHLEQKKDDDKKNADTENRETLGTRIVSMALNIAVSNSTPCLLILDAFFPGASVFKLAASVWSIQLKQPILTLIVKGKKNCTAYFEPSEAEVEGRKRKYGEKVMIMELFDQKHLFTKLQCMVYGKLEEVEIVALNLLWKPTGSLIRFVLAETSHGRIILMCSDLMQDPVAALEVYSKRVRIEIMFDMLKNLMGAFNYRFWTKSMPRHSRKPLKNKYLKQPSSSVAVRNIVLCWETYECFVMLASISLGLLQLISLKYEQQVWNHFGAYLRTKSREVPSERTVKHVIGRLLMKNFLSFAPGAICREIRKMFVIEFLDDFAADNHEKRFALS
jgi:hypothetical protein